MDNKVEQDKYLEEIDELERLRRKRRNKVIQNKKKKHLIDDYYWGFIVAFFGIILTIFANGLVIFIITSILSK